MYFEDYGHWLFLYENSLTSEPVMKIGPDTPANFSDLLGKNATYLIDGDMMFIFKIKQEGQAYKVVVDDFHRNMKYCFANHKGHYTTENKPLNAETSAGHMIIHALEGQTTAKKIYKFDPRYKKLEQDPLKFLKDMYLAGMKKDCTKCHQECKERLGVY